MQGEKHGKAHLFQKKKKKDLDDENNDFGKESVSEKKMMAITGTRWRNGKWQKSGKEMENDRN